MSSSGGKGGSQESDISKAMQPFRDRFMADAQTASRMEYLPFVGAEVAALNPYEKQSMQATNSMANAFNMGGGLPANPDSMMPDKMQLANGMEGYSSAPLFFDAVLQAQQAAPNYHRQRSQILTPPTNAEAGIYGGPYANPQGPGSPGAVAPGGPDINGYGPNQLLLMDIMRGMGR